MLKSLESAFITNFKTHNGKPLINSHTKFEENLEETGKY